MTAFREVLATQRWDDHRYYHHSLVNQSLHLLSATSFLSAYVIMIWSPAMAAIFGWMVAMVCRQVGHFFFEPKGYDTVNQATHEYKEQIKVGYNLRRKVVLLSIWALSPLILYFEPSLFGLMRPRAPGTAAFLRQVGQVWLCLGVAGLLFRTVQLCIIRDVQTGLVWFTKIMTDPIHDIKLYHKAPLRLWRREFGHDADDASAIGETIALDPRG